MSQRIRFTAVGAGFWSRYQLAAWRELPEVECVALCDRDQAKAKALAAALGIPAVYEDAEDMLRRERPAFVDVITTEESHAALVHLAARHRTPVVCQKPMSLDLDTARGMVAACREARIPFAVHENFRFQAPMRALKRILDEGRIGTPYRARLEMVSSFAAFANQPYLKQLDRFIIGDVGTHLLDMARFFFGEAERVFCTTQRIHTDIRGEDVATVVLQTRSRATVTCLLGLAETPVAEDHFPQTFLFVEGTKGSLALGPHFRIDVTTRDGTESRRFAPQRYPWADPDYLVLHSSMVACNRDLMEGMLGRRPAETSGDDNLRTLGLVAASYESARTGQVVSVPADPR